MKMFFKDYRLVSIMAFSCLFAYLLSFVFEGQVLYSIIDVFGAQTHTYSPQLSHISPDCFPAAAS